MDELSMDLASRRYSGEQLELAGWFRRHAVAVAAGRPVAHEQHLLALGRGEAASCADTARRAGLVEAIAYGDPGFPLAAPSLSLAGALVQTLGDQRLRDYFGRYVAEQRCQSFLALAEPEAAGAECRLDEGGLLHGEKLLFGSGALAPIGVALVRTGDGFLDTAALLLTPDLLQRPGVARQPIPGRGPRSAAQSHLRFERVAVPPELLLGQHRRPIERGTMAVIKVLHRFRPCLAAMALGHAQALVDHARLHGHGGLRDHLDYFDQQLAQARALNQDTAAQVDASPLQGSQATQSARRAAALVERIGQHLGRHLPPAALAAHPWLTRALADVWTYEYAEGSPAGHPRSAPPLAEVAVGG